MSIGLKQMTYKKISDYGIVGNGLTLALIGNDGALDWMCLPYMDSPSIFAANLDYDRGGRFLVQPDGDPDAVQTYIPRTNILKTLFRTGRGEVELLDFMPAGPALEADKDNRTRLLRRIRCLQGQVSIRIECKLRFEYGLITPIWSDIGPAMWSCQGREEQVTLFASRQLRWHDEQTSVRLAEGETLWIGLNYGALTTVPNVGEMENMLRQTKGYWVSWTRAQETGKYPRRGLWQDALDRGALVLKLLQFRDTGAIAAAASCSFPTIVYGERNWDYRFSWIRDTSMTLTALYELGHVQEVSLYLDWLKKLACRDEGASLEVLYTLREPVAPSGEQTLEHLSGYKNSRPVLTGQYNIGQHQHDIYGEILEMIFAISRLVGKIDPDYWKFVRAQVNHVVKIWRQKDNGIWELRTGPHHVTHSKVMCWVALDRGIKIAEHYGFPAELEVWKKERQAVHQDVLAHGYNQARQCFTQHYDTDAVDAALLLLPLVGFLPFDHPMISNTIRAIEEDLLVDGIPLRYRNDDGLPGQEHGWLICLFWYLRCLIGQERFEEVDDYLRRAEHYANHLGLFGEEYDTRFQEITGNFPQAFSHIGFITTVLEYLDAGRIRKPALPVTLSTKISLLVKPRLLTPLEAENKTERTADPGVQVKHIMNTLRGQFYDGHEQRVNYGLIRASDYYGDFQKAVGALASFELESLGPDQQRIAFWTNVFNALVIHAVIELGIEESVKEVPFFFQRSQYDIGGYRLSLSDIEHGLLRGNAVPPYLLFRPFARRDPRLALRIQKPDPRVHFALVCASRTCPPIEAYEADKLEEQLDTSALVFINATTRIDQKAGWIAISKIFKWYQADFQMSAAELLRYIASYLYDAQASEWLAGHADIPINYLDYDWRLNR
ncbi:MAG: glycoside hydrolase family 15 protein [Desulfobulbaceae bacterium]|nr:glycoside hydrolase family 15 protein [Desulfobulbaceae bacterium]